MNETQQANLAGPATTTFLPSVILKGNSYGGAVLAVASPKCDIRRPGEQGLLIATNHSIDGSIPSPQGFSPEYRENSRARHDWLTEILSEADPKDHTPDLGKTGPRRHARQMARMPTRARRLPHDLQLDCPVCP